MNSAALHAAAAALLSAYDTHRPIGRLTADHPDMTVEDAYRIQVLQSERWLAAGRRLIGRKVGLTSPAMQAQMGVDTPDFGLLLDTMVLDADTPIAAERFLQPRAEPEVAFVLSQELMGPGVSTEQAAAAIGAVKPSLEIIDSRIRDWNITLRDTIADNASSGGLVLGVDECPPERLDLIGMTCELYRDGELIESGTGDAVLGSPVNSLAWLANTLGALGVSLEAGAIVLPGSITASVPLIPGSVLEARFAGLGTVSARLAP